MSIAALMKSLEPHFTRELARDERAYAATQVAKPLDPITDAVPGGNDLDEVPDEVLGGQAWPVSGDEE